jgi:hypothetical protein
LAVFRKLAQPAANQVILDAVVFVAQRERAANGVS